MKKITAWFINGLLIVVPVGITVLVVTRIIYWIEGVVGKVGGIINSVIDPWLILLISLVVILAVGALGTTLFFKPLLTFLDHALEKTPVVKTVYSSIKDIFSALVGSKKKFNKPVMVAVSEDKTIRQIGFITSEDLSHLHIPGALVAVYLPTSYSFAGKVLIVPKDYIVPVNAPPGDVMKFVLSGGITEAD
ncbi:MAG: DUF502 domain-containing protein [Bacteroidia bacterium]|nr:DUF502 domain-containing protein [Bacteroidia bacterium]